MGKNSTPKIYRKLDLSLSKIGKIIKKKILKKKKMGKISQPRKFMNNPI